MTEERVIRPKKPNNIDELRQLKQAKKEAKKKLNSKPQTEQSPPGKVFERSFATVPDQPTLDTISGNIRVMTFNVRIRIAFFFRLLLTDNLIDIGTIFDQTKIIS